MSATDIFISYARTDRPAARIFAERFAEEGFSVWWDASLHSGETFDEVIEQRLRDAKAVVVLWSPRSVASRWVRAEATLADRRNKLAPAIIEPCDRPIIFELTHAAELSDWHGDKDDPRWQAFVVDLHHLIDAVRAREGAEAAAAPKEAPAPVAPVSRQPLRPGNDDVIVAKKVRAPEPVPSLVPQAAEDDPAAEVHCLQREHAIGGEELFVIDSTGLKMGRTAPADIVIADKSVSREHCMIGLANDELLVSDLNSTNGTYVDGERIARATILPTGSELRLGQAVLTHVICTRGDAARRNAEGAEIRAAGVLGGARLAASS